MERGLRISVLSWPWKSSVSQCLYSSWIVLIRLAHCLCVTWKLKAIILVPWVRTCCFVPISSWGRAAIGIFVAEIQTLTKFNTLDLTVEDATAIQGLASLCQAVFSPCCSGSSCWRHWLPGLPPQCKQAFQKGFPVITAISS